MFAVSNDEGKTWQKHSGGLMDWFDSEGNVNGDGENKKGNKK
jgi:hypothetical protein